MNILLLAPTLRRAPHPVGFDPVAGLTALEDHTVSCLGIAELYQNMGQLGAWQKILQEADRAQADVLIYFLGAEFDFPPAWFAELKCHKVLHVGDDELYFEVCHRHYALMFDLILSTNPLIERYQMLGLEARYAGGGFLGSAGAESVGQERPIPASFIGDVRPTMYPERSALLKKLEQSGIAIEVWGLGSKRGRATPEEARRVLRQSRIVLNFTDTARLPPLCRGTPILARHRQVKGRCQESALQGAFVLSQYAPGIERAFVPGEEIGVFHNAEEMLALVRSYLGDDARRLAMAARAHARALCEYESHAFWSQTLRDIASLLKEPRGSPEEIHPDQQFEWAYSAYRMKYFVGFVFAGRIGLAWQELWPALKRGWQVPAYLLQCAAHGLSSAAGSSVSARLLYRAAQFLKTMVSRARSVASGGAA
jgi:hypothetical protein